MILKPIQSSFFLIMRELLQICEQIFPVIVVRMEDEDYYM